MITLLVSGLCVDYEKTVQGPLVADFKVRQDDFIEKQGGKMSNNWTTSARENRENPQKPHGMKDAFRCFEAGLECSVAEL